MKKTILYISIATIFIAFASCNENEDLIKPVINLIEPEDEAAFKPGSAIHFEMELSDDTELKSYKVEIHSNFDGHGHSATIAKVRTLEIQVPFSYSNSWDVSGLKNTHIHHHEIVIPENATTGHYHFMVYCTDKAGNESHVAREIEISWDAPDEVE
jgi:hypothetical protein